MANHATNRLFEALPGEGADPYEEPGLAKVTNFQGRSGREGAVAKAIGLDLLKEMAATVEQPARQVEGFLSDGRVSGRNGRSFLVLVRGCHDDTKDSGLRRSDTVQKMGFQAMQLRRHQTLPLLVLTSDLPPRDSAPGRYLAAISPDIWDAIAWRGDLPGIWRLQAALHDPAELDPPTAPWRSPIQRPDHLDIA